MPTVLNFVLQVLAALPSLMEAGTSAYNLVVSANASAAQMQAESRGPTDAEWTAIHAAIDAAVAELKG